MVRADSATSYRYDIDRTYAGSVEASTSTPEARVRKPGDPAGNHSPAADQRLQPRSGAEGTVALPRPRPADLDARHHGPLQADRARSDLGHPPARRLHGRVLALLRPARRGDLDGLPYALFSLTALVPWTFFSNALLLGSDSLVSNSALVSKVYFPRIFMPAGMLVAGFVDLAISFVILVVDRPCLGVRSVGRRPALPVLVAIAAAARPRNQRSAFGDQRPLSRCPLRRPLRDSDVALRRRSPTRAASRRAVAHGLRHQPDGRRRRRLPLGDARNAGRAAGADRVSAVSAVLLLLAGLAYFDRVERGFADFV